MNYVWRILVIGLINENLLLIYFNYRFINSMDYCVICGMNLGMNSMNIFGRNRNIWMWFDMNVIQNIVR